MYIKSVQIRNYKCFFESGVLELKPGFSIFVGQNNAGKTALLEALSLRVEGNPHRSPQALPSASHHPRPASEVEVKVVIPITEIVNNAVRPGQTFGWPLPQLGTRLARQCGFDRGRGYQADTHSIAEWVYNLGAVEFGLSFRATKEETFRLRWSTLDSYETQAAVQGGYPHVELRVSEDRSLSATVIDTKQRACGVGQILANYLVESGIYYFQAQRFNAGTCPYGPNSILASNSANLAEVLFDLQAKVGLFNSYNHLVRLVFPSLKRITITHDGHGTDLKILVWKTLDADPDLDREIFATELNESGTGLGQVLAILYVILTSHFPRTVIIDEPQSFLHPGALTRLFELLKQFPQHQYIVATHSPTVITATHPAGIVLVKQHEGVAEWERIDSTKETSLRHYLTEIGATLSDVFGAEFILWVEGLTEELCFPLIIEKLVGRTLRGTVIRGVRNTGDLEGRHAEAVIEIYERLSGSASLLPPALAFIFDGECRTPKQRDEIQNRAKSSVLFTPRRMYEGYLLNADAIVAVLNATDPSGQTNASRAEVAGALEEILSEPALYGTEGVPGVDRESKVDAAKLLKRLFAKLSDSRVQYQKTKHGPLLTEWLVENSPSDLKELADLIARALSLGGAKESI